MEIYVCESKRFGEGIAINEHGEFAAFYQGKAYGIAHLSSKITAT